jgi:type III secretory pathway component EscV
MSVSKLMVVLRSLVEEGVPINNLRGILEAAAQESAGSSAAEMVEVVRAGNKRVITHSLTRGSASLEVFFVDREVEEMVRSAVRSGPKGPYLSLAPGLAAEIKAAGDRAFGEHTEMVVLASPDVRPYLRQILGRGRPGVVVVSIHELDVDLEVESIGKVCVRDRG